MGQPGHQGISLEQDGKHCEETHSDERLLRTLDEPIV